ncbi:MAG: sensor histidine kinase [Trebonia sp.]
MADEGSAAPGWDTPGGLGQLSLERVSVALLRTPFSARAWLAAASLVLSVLVGACFFAAAAVALVAGAALAGIPGTATARDALTARLPARLTRFDRWRMQNLNGIDIGVRVSPDGGRLSLRPALYQLVRFPAAAALALLSYFWWANSLLFLLLPVIRPARLTIAVFSLKFGEVALTPGGLVAGVTIGVVMVFVGVQVVRAAAALDAALARAMLGPSRTSVEIARLTQARTMAVQAAESERRRIERDLHDGFQPRLVSLAAQIGLAMARFDRDPAAARAMLGQAHLEAKTAMADLRGVIRGLHPPVLDERGLDASLSGLIIGCPVPVAVDVSLARRPDATREAIAYFVAAEAITNISRHSGARKATVTITDASGPLMIVVEDDGQGGATAAPGGGLAGLAARVAAVDGTLTTTSPPGGPTRIEAVLP